MAASGSKAELKASVNVHPMGSQVFLVGLIVAGCLSMFCGAFLFSLKVAVGWVFILLAVFLFAGAGLAWKKSQSDSDLKNAHPTHFEFPDGLKVTTDSRTLRSREGVDGVIKVLQELISRKPLPDPDGLVDSKNQQIPDSQADAQILVNKINADTQAVTNSLIDAMGLSGDASKVIQVPDSTDGNAIDHEVPPGLNIAETSKGS